MAAIMAAIAGLFMWRKSGIDKALDDERAAVAAINADLQQTKTEKEKEHLTDAIKNGRAVDDMSSGDLDEFMRQHNEKYGNG